MKSTCVGRVVHPELDQLVGRHRLGALDALRDRLAERDVRRRVLVEERVQERQPGAADARVAVDERELAESARAFLGLDLRRMTSSPLDAPMRGDLAVRELQLEVADDRAAEHERQASSGSCPRPARCGAVNTSSVGRFGTCRWPQAVSASAATQRDCGSRPTVRSVPGPGSGSRRSGARSASARAWSILSMCSRQAATGSGSSRRTVSADGLPEPLDVGLAEHRLRPARVRAADDRPGELPAGDQLEVRLRSSSIRALATRSWSRSAKRSGSASPVIRIVAPWRSARSSSRERARAASSRATPSGRAAISALRIRASLIATSTQRAPARYAGGRRRGREPRRDARARS